MLDKVLELFEIIPDYDLNVLRPGQYFFELTSNVLMGMKEVLSTEKPDVVLVHGDTATPMTTSLDTFYQHIFVGHAEAGLRTYDIYSPFPEEVNRQMTSIMADFHFAPAAIANQNLLSEYVTGEKLLAQVIR